MEEVIALSQQFAKQQTKMAFAMVVSAALTFFVTSIVAPEISGLGLAIAAATGFSVGVWCHPGVYRRSNGSLTLAIVLIVAMWTAPVIVILTSITG